MHRRLPILVCIAAGVFMTAQYFVDAPAVAAVYRAVLEWMQIIFVCALLVGALRVVTGHLQTISRRDSNWPYAAIALFGVALMVGLGFGFGNEPHTPFLWVFDHLQVPMQTTVFSLLAFYAASAAFRGFRARRLDSAILVLAALVVLLGRVPIGEMVSPHVPTVVGWVLDVPAVAAKRAILIGIGLGMAATALKVIVGMERTYLGGR